MHTIITHSEAETVSLAAQIAARVQVGDILALEGTLGAGKTAFCRGFIQSLSPKTLEVPSPTFTLLQIYETPHFEVYHFDMYRLKCPEEAYEIGIEEAFSEGVSLIEWPEKIRPLLPKKHITLRFDILSGGERRITIEGIDR